MVMMGLQRKIAMDGEHVGPKWKALKRQIVEVLCSGEYAPGDPLPSENQLSKSVGVARNTVRKAFDDLEQDGLITRVRGSGTFVSVPKNKKNKPRRSLEAYGLLIPEIRRSLFPSLVKGFDVKASSENHQTLICNTDYDINKQGNIILQIIDKELAGVAIVPPTLQPTPLHQIRQLQANHIPVVFCHRRIPGIPAPLVSWNFEDVGKLAGRALAEKGHKNIVFFGVYKYKLTEAYEQGLRDSLRLFGIDLPEENIVFGPHRISPDIDDIKDSMISDFLSRNNRPTAVFCNDDNEAERVYWIAHSKGIRVPEELSIVGFGDIRRDTPFRKMLSSVVVNEYDLGAKAADILGKMCQGQCNIDDNSTVFMDLELLEASTVGPAPH